MRPPTRGRKAAAIAVVVVLGAVVAVLCAIALFRPQAAATDGDAEPLPALSPTPSATSSPATTPTPTPPPAQMDRADERFLSFNGTSAWRATAGSCAGEAPLLQRMNNQGVWVDVVSRANAPRQVASLDAYSDGAELVAGVDDACTTASLRTFSAGAEWASYDGALARSRYIDLTDAGIVHTSDGDIAAPCMNATGLRASGDVVALICDEQAWLQTEDAWTALALTNVKVLAIDDADVIIGNQSADCTGLTLTRVSGTENTTIGCADSVDATQPMALAAADDGLVVWVGDEMIEVAG